MTEACLAFGGNVGDSRTLLGQALDALCEGPDVGLLKRSSDYRTPPWGDTAQARFINFCAVVDTTLAPRALLERAHEIERRFGRDRSHERHWGPRTVDIDILTYGDVSLHEPDLTLPHPRLFERPFVLVPLAEIAGGRIIAGRTVGEAAARADHTGIEKLPSR